MARHPPGADTGGRPRDVHRELGRLEEAAAHVTRLIDQALVDAYEAAGAELGDPAAREEVRARYLDAAGNRRLLAQTVALDREIRHLVALIDALDVPRQEKRRRRRGRLGLDPYTRAIAEAAIALDRLCPTVEEPH